MHGGVLRLAGVPFTHDLRWMAAVLEGGTGARLSHFAAAAVHGWDVRSSRPQITVPYARTVESPGIDVYRTRRLGDLVMVRNIPATSKARTALDLAAVMGDRFPEFLQNTVNDGRVRVEQLLAVLDRRGGRGVEGTVLLRATLAGGLVDEKIQRRLELRLARLIRSADVPPPVRQLDLTCVDGRPVVLDNAWPQRKIAVEGEGLRWHGSASQARKTRERARSITASGWDLYAYGWSDVAETAEATRCEIESFFCEDSAGRSPAKSSQKVA
jgi:hypothetical protein